MTVSVPSVPGKSQRVLIDKRQSAKATSTAARLYKKPLQSAGLEQSVQSANTFTSFASGSKNKQAAAFGSKDLRFDGKLELMEYFNREPGPGTYSENASTVESSLMTEMSKLRDFRGQPIDRTFGVKEKRFHQLADMAQCDPKIAVGPADYEPQEPRKHITGPRIDYKGDFSLPFNEKNPINYVKPITVNIYFKQTTPGVGQYDPQPVRKQEQGAKNKFDSKT